MRKYQRIWEQVKNNPNKPVSLAAEYSMHERIIKAVTKEKSQDLGWKMLMLERGEKYALMHDVDAKCIVFYLVDVSHQLRIGIDSL
jgi:hydroxyacyl-ACP dehydratase HTD2-like protein with hotdog domain